MYDRLLGRHEPVLKILPAVPDFRNKPGLQIGDQIRPFNAREDGSGMDPGEFASHMQPSLVLNPWPLIKKATKTAPEFEKRVIMFPKVYIGDTHSHIVQTSWAIIGLLAANYPDHRPIKQACKLLMDKQKPAGNWEDETIVGSAHETIAVDSPLFNFYWPMFALGKAFKQFGNLVVDETKSG
ncbi:hypothetical protein H4Q26_014930 [Puccinia striiformis f. sp. tritici PST-130]|nr:hypothetical protein H4Q26_014930 [Puccinia striiformis f. sp. tritici PST-130]